MKVALKDSASALSALDPTALMLRHGLGRPDDAEALERAVDTALRDAPTADLGGTATTRGMGDTVLQALEG